jgi:plasmid maintenance system antidote protein VapI
MNNAQHTPEPWCVGNHPGDSSGTGWREILASSEFGPMYLAQALEANARRIVACVNACAGISTRMLEDIGPSGVENGEMWKRAQKQLDEMVAALRALDQAENGPWDGAEQARYIASAKAQARAVLAKVEK